MKVSFDCLYLYKQSRQNYRFLAALCLSILLHAVVIGSWKTHGVTPPLGGSIRLNVKLTNSSAADDGENNQVPNTHQKEVLVKLSADKANTPNILQTKPVDSAGELTNTALMPGMVLVILSISKDGHVKEITWTQLPPISENKLQALEVFLRNENYLAMGSQYFIRKIVDVTQ